MWRYLPRVSCLCSLLRNSHDVLRILRIISSPSPSKDLQILFPFYVRILQIFRKKKLDFQSRTLENRAIPLITHLDGSSIPVPRGMGLVPPRFPRAAPALRAAGHGPDALPKVFLSRHLLVSSWAFPARPAAHTV